MSPATKRNNLRVVRGPAGTQQRVAGTVTAIADIRGMRHVDLAERAGITPDKLSKSLNMGRKFTLEEMERLADALGVPVSILGEGGDEIRRRAFAGVTTHPTGPDDTGGQEISSTRWYEGNVVDIGSRRNALTVRAA